MLTVKKNKRKKKEYTHSCRKCILHWCVTSFDYEAVTFPNESFMNRQHLCTSYGKKNYELRTVWCAYYGRARMCDARRGRERIKKAEEGKETTRWRDSSAWEKQMIQTKMELVMSDFKRCMVNIIDEFRVRSQLSLHVCIIKRLKFTSSLLIRKEFWDSLIRLDLDRIRRHESSLTSLCLHWLYRSSTVIRCHSENEEYTYDRSNFFTIFTNLLDSRISNFI